MFLSIKHYPNMGKPLENKGSILTYNWEAVNLSPAQITQHITSGKPIAVSQYTGGHRNKRHFLKSSILALDYDQNLSDVDYQALIGSDFFRRHCFLIVQTASSKPDSRRCRVLFQLDQVVENVEDYSALVRFIISVAPVGADPAAKDASRAFYGSRPGTVPDFYNPSNVLKIGAILAEIKVEREREREAREKRRDIELSGDLIRDIEKGLGVTAYNADHWSNPIPCIKQHQNDEKRPAAFWNEDSHILHCFKCGVSYLAKEVAGHLGIEWRSAPPPDRSRDFAAMPGESERPRYNLVALPSPLRKAMIKDGMTNLCRLIDALLWEEIPSNHVIQAGDMVRIMRRYEMTRSAVYRVIGNLSHKINAMGLSRKYNVAESGIQSGAGRKAGEYTLDGILAALEALYGYSIHNAGDYLYNHVAALVSPKNYRAYAVLESIPEIEMNLSLKEMGAAFGLSAGTMSKYTRELRDQGLIAIASHFKYRELTMDDIGGLSLVIDEWKAKFSNAFIEMHRLIDGVRLPYLHSGGKSGIPNNRIPAKYEAVMTFFYKSLKRSKIKTVNTNIGFVLVTKLRNSYRRLPLVNFSNPLLGRLVESVAA